MSEPTYTVTSYGAKHTITRGAHLRWFDPRRIWWRWRDR